MEHSKSPIIMERYCSKVDCNVVIMKNIVKNDGSYKCISHTDCSEKNTCKAFSTTKDKLRNTQTG